MILSSYRLRTSRTRASPTISWLKLIARRSAVAIRVSTFTSGIGRIAMSTDIAKTSGDSYSVMPLRRPQDDHKAFGRKTKEGQRRSKQCDGRIRMISLAVAGLTKLIALRAMSPAVHAR